MPISLSMNETPIDFRLTRSKVKVTMVTFVKQCKHGFVSVHYLENCLSHGFHISHADWSWSENDPIDFQLNKSMVKVTWHIFGIRYKQFLLNILKTIDYKVTYSCTYESPFYQNFFSTEGARGYMFRPTILDFCSAFVFLTECRNYGQQWIYALISVYILALSL